MAAVGAPGHTVAAQPDAVRQIESCALELPEDVQFQLDQFKQLLSEAQKALRAVAVQVPNPSELAKVEEPLDRARLCMALAKAVNALHHVYLRAHGRDPFAPPTVGGVAIGRQELDRVRQYDKKVTRAVKDAELRASRPTLSLDVAAASRFIDAAIPDLTEQQRKDLKRAAQAVEAKRGEAQRGSKKARGASGQAEERQPPPQQQQQGEKGQRGQTSTGAGVGGAATAAAAASRGAREAAEEFLAALAAADGVLGQGQGGS